MKAVVLREFGGPEVLQPEHVARPEPSAGEVLVRVHAAGVHTLDCATRAGWGGASIRGDFPIIPGWEFSGVVEAPGPGVTRFRPGDRVYGLPRYPELARTYAEYATVPQQDLAFKPRNLSHLEAACVPLDALTAWQALDFLHTGPGQTLLVSPVTSRVGTVAAHLAAVRGAQVVGTGASPGPVHEALVTGTPDGTVLRALKPGGGPVCLGAGSPSSALPGVRVMSLQVRPSGAQLEQLAQLIEQGALPFTVDEVFPLDAAAQAHRQREAHPFSGGIALRLI